MSAATMTRKIGNVHRRAVPRTARPIDRSAVKDFINSYQGFIWALANKFTSSDEEAEAVAREIFMDIRRYAERVKDAQLDELAIVNQIARRRLVRFVQQTK